LLAEILLSIDQIGARVQAVDQEFKRSLEAKDGQIEKEKAEKEKLQDEFDQRGDDIKKLKDHKAAYVKLKQRIAELHTAAQSP
jgi:hypothetical protein